MGKDEKEAINKIMNARRELMNAIDGNPSKKELFIVLIVAFVYSFYPAFVTMHLVNWLVPPFYEDISMTFLQAYIFRYMFRYLFTSNKSNDKVTMKAFREKFISSFISETYYLLAGSIIFYLFIR